MPIHFEHSVDVSRAPEQAFEVIDDFAMTPKWLERCTLLEAVSPGPHMIGTKLKYEYRERGRTGTMAGEVVARIPNERLTMHYGDKLMAVTVDFRIAKTEGGARLTHAIEITPRTFFAKLFSPMIRRHIPKQTIDAMESLKGLLESRPQ